MRISDWSSDVCSSDLVLLNDPFAGGTHLNDLPLVTPSFAGERLVGWVANRAHHADVGGAAPGSIPADATEIQQEGLRLPPTRLTDEIRAILLAASRTPDERAGDLDAQVGANLVGAQRSEEHTSELQSLMRIPYAVFCLKKKTLKKRR